MKKTIMMMLAAIMTFAGLTATAQKSSSYLVGSVSYQKSKGADAEYSVSPRVGYYLTNKSSVGIFGGVGESAQGSTASIAAFGRNDFMKIGKNCIVFVEASVASSTAKSDTAKVSRFDANFGLGANYILSSKWGLTMNLANIFNYTKSEGKSTTTFGFGSINNPFTMANVGLFYAF